MGGVREDVKAPGAEEVLPGGSKAVTEAVSGKAEVAIFLQGRNNCWGEQTERVSLFLPYGEVFEESCEPEQINI